jgi:hypothetical protein
LRWGYDRGTPIDRYYLDRFLHANADVITGRVLEVHDARYTTRFGHDLVTVDVVDIEPANAAATVVADLAVPQSLPAARYDCAVITQTLMYVSDLSCAVANLWQSIAPGGTLIVTMPSISRVDPDIGDLDRWRVTGRGLEEALRRGCDDGVVSVVTFGSVLTASAFLYGVACEELTTDELDVFDPLYPVLVAGRATKPAASPR